MGVGAVAHTEPWRSLTRLFLATVCCEKGLQSLEGWQLSAAAEGAHATIIHLYYPHSTTQTGAILIFDMDPRCFLSFIQYNSRHPLKIIVTFINNLSKKQWACSVKTAPKLQTNSNFPPPPDTSCQVHSIYIFILEVPVDTELAAAMTLML